MGGAHSSPNEAHLENKRARSPKHLIRPTDFPPAVIAPRGSSSPAARGDECGGLRGTNVLRARRPPSARTMGHVCPQIDSPAVESCRGRTPAVVSALLACSRPGAPALELLSPCGVLTRKGKAGTPEDVPQLRESCGVRWETWMLFDGKTQGDHESCLIPSLHGYT